MRTVEITRRLYIAVTQAEDGTVGLVVATFRDQPPRRLGAEEHLRHDNQRRHSSLRIPSVAARAQEDIVRTLASMSRQLRPVI